MNEDSKPFLSGSVTLSSIVGFGFVSRLLTCGICGSEFICGAPGPCWCSSVKVEDEKRKLLAILANDCVCGSCLEKGTGLPGEQH